MTPDAMAPALGLAPAAGPLDLAPAALAFAPSGAEGALAEHVQKLQASCAPIWIGLGVLLASTMILYERRPRPPQRPASAIKVRWVR